MKRQRQLRFWTVALPTALLAGFGVFLILIVAAWYNLRGSYNVCRNQGRTRMILTIAANEVEAFQAENSRLPKNLTEIPDLGFGSSDVPIDAWGNAIQYSSSDRNFTLYSLGKDGKQGGTGLDAELYHDDRNHDDTLISFPAFCLESEPEEVDAIRFVMVGIIAGGFVIFAVLVPIARRNEKDPLTYMPNLRSVLGVAVLAVLFGAVLMVLYIPSGH